MSCNWHQLPYLESAGGGTRTRTRVTPHRFLRPARLPFRHSGTEQGRPTGRPYGTATRTSLHQSNPSLKRRGAGGQSRTGDSRIFSAVLYH